jgi:hypothetical protein
MEMNMYLRKTLSVSIVAMSLFVAAGFAAGAAAAAKDSGNLVLNYDATVAGNHLTGGKYNIQWKTHSPEATVTFKHEGKVVATAEGKVVDHGSKYDSNQVVYSQAADGSRVISEIRFGGSSQAIVFNE